MGRAYGWGVQRGTEVVAWRAMHPVHGGRRCGIHFVGVARGAKAASNRRDFSTLHLNFAHPRRTGPTNGPECMAYGRPQVLVARGESSTVRPTLTSSRLP